MAKENLKPNEITAPTLFIGVGGTGSKIVKLVAEMCKPGEQENVNFVCLDTNVNDLNSVASSKANIYYMQTSSTQTVGDYLNYDRDARCNWFPKNAVIYDKTVSEGAGQVRAISRLALNASIKTGKINSLYAAIDDLFRKDGKEMKQAMRVVIVSTASGGTGSGIMTPLAMFVRDYVTNKYPNASLIVRALVLLPETLDSVISSSSERESQRRNAYATIKEINAFMMKGSGFFDVTVDLKRYSDLSIDFAVPGSDEMKKLGLLPFDFCFLLDGQNAEDSTMVNISQYIQQAARALYQQNIGPMQRDAFSMEDNIIKEMSAPGKYGRNRFGGIGAGTLRYPYEDVVRYVAYSWAMDAIGGEGEAAKWARYDRQHLNKVREAKQQGKPETEWPKLEESYVSDVASGRDNFSTTLYNTYLSTADERVDTFLGALLENVLGRVKENHEISNAVLACSGAGKEIDYAAEAGKAQEIKNNLDQYKAVVTRVVKKLASASAESIFYNENKTENTRDDFTLERLMKSLQDEAMHPNAMRYMLYMTQTAMNERLEMAAAQLKSTERNLESYSSTADSVDKFNAPHTNEDERTLDELVAAVNNDDGGILKANQLKQSNEMLRNHFVGYLKNIEKYVNFLTTVEVLTVGLSYIRKLSEKFESFYGQFKVKVEGLCRRQDELVDALVFRKGDSVKNICATRELLDELAKATMNTANEGSMLDPALNARIFDAVKANVIFDREIQNSDIVEEDRRVDIFDDILLGYFVDSVTDKCRNLDMNIIEAIAMEKRLLARIEARESLGKGEKVFDKVDPKDVENYIFKTLMMGRRLAAPGIQRIRSEESRELVLCAYNKSLNDMRNYRIDQLMPKGTSASGVDTVSRYEMNFFNALYNLTPDKLDKFAAPSKSETRSKNAGLYHNAYVTYARNIGPDSTKCSTISTHIDKRWDSIAVMPELDLDFQAQRILAIQQALIYALVYGAISLRPLSSAANCRSVYKYENSEERYVELTVSNGTMCDEFYEILDALYVNCAMVEDIGTICKNKRRRDETRNPNYEDTGFYKALGDFRMDIVTKEDRQASLFEIPVAYYATLPNSKRYVSEISSLVDAVIRTMRDELCRWEACTDVRFRLCEELKDQFDLLMKNYPVYQEKYKLPAETNPVLDIIFRKIRKVVEATPELQNYEAIIDDMRSQLQA